MNRDLVFGASGAIVAVVYYGFASSIPTSALADAVGPRGLPIVYAAILLFLSLLLIIRSVRTRNMEPGTQSFHVARVAGMLAIGAGYIVLVPWLGYVVTLAGLIVAATWYQTRVVTKGALAVAVAGAIVFWLIFVVLLGIPQPSGIWTS